VPAKIRFGVYELDVAGMELRKNGVRIRLQEQPFRILATLVDRPGVVITREELKDRMWASDTFVDFDQSLNKAVNRLREVLNDDASQPRYIETVPRRGYRFVAHVTDVSPPPQVLAQPAPPVADGGNTRHLTDEPASAPLPA
jgi:DNA-binding winged helix-turn-helix (wHTH) protein